jgi:Leucine-rich repeat (LRR) protein
MGVVAAGAVARLCGPTSPDPGPSAEVPADPKPEPWEVTVARMPPAEQFAAVKARLREVNPGFNADASNFVADGGVVTTLFLLDTRKLTDLGPVRALAGLKFLELIGDGVRDLGPLRGLKLVRLSSNGNPIRDLRPLEGMPLEGLGVWLGACPDLSPLRGMKLTTINCGGIGELRDLSPLAGMPLRELCINHTRVCDLAPLRGMPLDTLEATHTLVTDLSPLVGLPLTRINVTGSKVTDYSPLRRLPLRSVRLDYDPSVRDLLRSIPTLTSVNGRPAADVLGSN